ncbi:MAG: hypothetical protein J0I21_10445 [Alphaproteobacteria bacterium]|nr:hypothetical protein [Alphaproteobacteria bacterium]
MAAAVGCGVALGAADLPPACKPPADGLQVCMAQQVCTCRYDPGGSLTGRVAGWRWQCSIMQMCDSTPPAGLDSSPPPPPMGPFYITPNIQPPSQQPTQPSQQPTFTPASPLLRGR